MKVIGEGVIHFHDAQDECPHTPSEETLWQESVVLLAWDVQQQVYVFFRMSQVPNKDGGVATVWLNAWTPGYMYKHTEDSLPFSGCQINTDGFSVGNGLCRYQYDGAHHWQVQDGEVNIDVTMTDAHQGLSYMADSSASMQSVLKGHVEATGKVSGTVCIGDKRYDMAGIAWRDHSWGKRDWFQFRSHRFYPAMFGKDFNFFALTFVGEDGSSIKNGVLIRGDEVQFTQNFDVVAYMGEDGVSNCGGHINLRLDGESHRLDFSPIGKSAISITHGFPLSDTLCTVTMGDKHGVGLAETSTNPHAGRKPAYIFDVPTAVGVVKNGLFAQ